MKILITGASSGIGFLVGCVLIDRGHKVFMTTHTLKEVDILKEKLKLLELEADTFKLDITRENDREIILSLDLNVIFLHAGVGDTGLLKDIDVDLIRNNFEVNVFSGLEMIQLFLKSNDKDKKIVLTSSLFANHACGYFGSYILSKSSVELMMKILKNESIFNNNKFIIIKPGAYHTGFNQYMILRGEDNISQDFISLINKIFLWIEEKELNSIVEKVVYAIEKGQYYKYSAPFIQALFLDN